ncbi:MAG: endonuclease III [Treponema sp.]|nr:endonuclease III [Treponema sp.]
MFLTGPTTECTKIKRSLRRSRLLTRNQIIQIMERLKAANPQPKSELEYVNPYTLLVAVVLSAQATDKSVNLATGPLFKIADSPQKMLELGLDGLIPYIKSIGLYRNKAANIIELSRQLISDFDGQVPDDRDKLMSLRGVGRKTANVVLNVIFHQPTMPVDTHLLRICPKIGLAQGTTPEQVEQSLLELIPPEYMDNAHHWLLLHGRYVCTARNPKCKECIINDICKAHQQAQGPQEDSIGRSI